MMGIRNAVKMAGKINQAIESKIWAKRRLYDKLSHYVEQKKDVLLSVELFKCLDSEEGVKIEGMVQDVERNAETASVRELNLLLGKDYDYKDCELSNTDCITTLEGLRKDIIALKDKMIHIDMITADNIQDIKRRYQKLKRGYIE